MSEERDPRPAPSSRVRALWLGEVPLKVAFWWHAMVVGTLINVLATLLFVALQSLKTPDAVSFAVFFLPIPYNVFIAIAVWHSAGRYAGPPLHAHLARLGVCLWAIGASLT
ncbi:MAG: hypothetical protein IH626_17165 [Rhodospirillales bacterium]|nr:hypothetical protein [Rhodospirillales bacterium]